MPGSIVLLGATGYAGGLALDALVRQGERPIIVGTRAGALRDLARQHGDLEWKTADAGDAQSIRSLVDAGDVLVTTVGPFNRLGRTVARAAAEQGAHYVDSTGEVSFVQHLLDEVDSVARSSGSVMLPAFGYDYVSGLLAAALACDRLPGATHVRVAYVVEGSLGDGRGMSQGTRRTVVEETGEAVVVLDGSKLVEHRMASSIFPWADDCGERFSLRAPRCSSFPGTLRPSGAWRCSTGGFRRWRIPCRACLSSPLR